MDNMVNGIRKDASIIFCKKRAKEINKNQKELTFMQCLDIAAKEMKYSSWFELRNNIKNNLIKINSSNINYINDYITEVFEHGFETIHFEVRNEKIKVKGRKFGILENINKTIIFNSFIKCLKDLDLDVNDFGWKSTEYYNIQSLPVYAQGKINFDVIITAKELILNHVEDFKQDDFYSKLKKLGLNEENIKDLTENFENKNYFLAGITGSGKSTLAEKIIKELEIKGNKIVSFSGYENYQEEQKMLFSFFRMAPDYFYIPEIRTIEHLMMMIKIIQTGHYVITTLHASSIDGIYQRLLSIGNNDIVDQLLDKSANHNHFFSYQKLEGILCSDCKKHNFSFEKVSSDEYLMSYINKNSKHKEAQQNIFTRGDGCKHHKKDTCSSGFIGRTLIMETFNINAQSKITLHIKIENNENKHLNSYEIMKDNKIEKYLRITGNDFKSNKFKKILNGVIEYN